MSHFNPIVDFTSKIYHRAKFGYKLLKTGNSPPPQLADRLFDTPSVRQYTDSTTEMASRQGRAGVNGEGAL